LHTGNRTINISLVAKKYHKLFYNLVIRPLYKMNVGEENFSEII